MKQRPEIDTVCLASHSCVIALTFLYLIAALVIVSEVAEHANQSMKYEVRSSIAPVKLGVLFVGNK